jgi:hypothetical protein
MDYLQFFSAVIQSLAWPSVVVILALVFRDPLHKLIKRIISLKYGESSVTFAEGLEEAQATADRVSETTDLPRLEAPTKPDDPYLELAAKHPEAAVMDSFKAVERAIKDYRTKLGLTDRRLDRQVVETILIGTPFERQGVELYRHLTNTRNAAVHATGQTITTAEAVAYRDVCNIFLDILREVEVIKTKLGESLKAADGT